MAAARLTVTELLPTPPLPEAMASTRVLAGTCVSGACSRAAQRALSMTSDRSSAVISPHSMVTVRTPGCAAMRVSTSFLICARSGQPAMVSFTPMVTSPSGVTRHAGRHPEVDDVAAELGIDDGAEQPLELLDRRRRHRAGHDRILPVAAV